MNEDQKQKEPCGMSESEPLHTAQARRIAALEARLLELEALVAANLPSRSVEAQLRLAALARAVKGRRLAQQAGEVQP